MAQQTINVGAAPNDGTGTPLRTAFQYTNSNFTELYTALGGGSGLPGASGQLIFNNGTSLAGDNELFYNATTNTLTTEKLIVPGNTQVATAGTLYVGTILNPKLKVDVAGTGETTIASATISGDLTVRTNKLAVTSTGVGCGTASPTEALHVNRSSGTGVFIRLQDSANSNYIGTDNGNFRILNGTSPVYDLLNIQQLGVFTFGDGAGGTRMTLNSTGLGVGRSPISKLTVDKASQTPGGTTPNGAFVITDTAGGNLALELGVNSAGSPWIQSRNSTTGAYYDLLLNPNGGNVGIGVVPSAWVAGAKALQFGAYGALAQSSSGNIELSFNSYNSGAGAYKYLQTDTASLYRASSVHSWFVAPSGTAGNAISFGDAKMTLDASGNLLVGTTSSIGKVSISYAYPSTGIGLTTDSNSAQTAIQFNTPAGLAGYINTSSTTTTYNSASDYRLKESVQPLFGGLARVSALKPSIYKWKADGSSGEGFLAHELAEVVPAAVSGEKDAVNEDGSIKPQGVDMSRVVPILVAAIQELTARVQTLETR